MQDLHLALEVNKPLLLSVENRGQRLLEVCDEEVVVDSVVTTKLDPLQEAFEILYEAIVDREGQLQMKLVQTQDLDASFADIIRWLVEMERTLSRQEPVSLQPVKVSRQKNDQEVSCHWFYVIVSSTDCLSRHAAQRRHDPVPWVGCLICM